jgi:hypothetical protein
VLLALVAGLHSGFRAFFHCCVQVLCARLDEHLPSRGADATPALRVRVLEALQTLRSRYAFFEKVCARVSLSHQAALTLASPARFLLQVLHDPFETQEIMARFPESPPAAVAREHIELPAPSQTPVSVSMDVHMTPLLSSLTTLPTESVTIVEKRARVSLFAEPLVVEHIVPAPSVPITTPPAPSPRLVGSMRFKNSVERLLSPTSVSPPSHGRKQQRASGQLREIRQHVDTLRFAHSKNYRELLEACVPYLTSSLALVHGALLTKVSSVVACSCIVCRALM